MKTLAKFAIAAALLLALAACQGGAVEQTSPSDGGVPAEGSPPPDGSGYPAPQEVPAEEAPASAYPSPS